MKKLITSILLLVSVSIFAQVDTSEYKENWFKYNWKNGAVIHSPVVLPDYVGEDTTVIVVLPTGEASYVLLSELGGGTTYYAGSNIVIENDTISAIGSGSVGNADSLGGVPANQYVLRSELADTAAAIRDDISGGGKTYFGGYGIEVGGYAENDTIEIDSSKIHTRFSLPMVTPQMYGAKGDGVTDDSQAFQDMANANPKGAIFYIPVTENFYNLDSAIQGQGNIQFPSNSTIISDGAKLKSAAGYGSLAFLSKENISVSGLVFDGGLNDDTINPSNPTNRLLTFDNCDNVSITNCKFYNITNRAINFSGVRNGLIKECVFDTIRTNTSGLLPIAITSGINVSGAKSRNIKVLYNDIRNSTADSVSQGGILIAGESDGSSTVDNVLIEGNYFFKMGRIENLGAGITGPRGDIDVYNDVKDLKIINNTSDSCTYISIKTNDIDRMFIYGNTIRNSRDRAINCNDRYGNIIDSNIVIKNNFLSGGIKLQHNISNAGGVNEIIGNTIDLRGYTQPYGIYTDRFGYFQNITGNTILGGGIFMEKESGESDASGTTEWTISRNVIICDTSKPINGIRIDPQQGLTGNTRSVGVVVSGNRIESVNDSLAAIKTGSDGTFDIRSNTVFGVSNRYNLSQTNTRYVIDGTEYISSFSEIGSNHIATIYTDTVRGRIYQVKDNGEVEGTVIKRVNGGSEYIDLINKFGNSTTRMYGDLDSSSYIGVTTGARLGIGLKKPLGQLHLKSIVTPSIVTPSASYDNLLIEGVGNVGMNIVSTRSNNAGIGFGDQDINVAGAIVYENSLDRLSLYTNSTLAATFNSTQDLIVANNITGDTLFGYVPSDNVIGGVTKTYVDSADATKAEKIDSVSVTANRAFNSGDANATLYAEGAGNDTLSFSGEFLTKKLDIVYLESPDSVTHVIDPTGITLKDLSNNTITSPVTVRAGAIRYMGNDSYRLLAQNASREYGWAIYNDGEYTSGSPYVISQNDTATIPINAATSITSQLPDGVTSFWNSSDSIFTPAKVGDDYVISLRLKCTASAANAGIIIYLDIGGSQGIILSDSRRLLRGAGTENRLNFEMSPFTMQTFIDYGGKFRVEAIGGDLSLYDMGIKITRISVGK